MPEADLDLFPVMNPNREVIITCSSDKHDWRNNLKILMDGQKTRKNGEISSMFSPFDAWNVNSAVKLVMTENKPIRIDNGKEEPLKKLTSAMTDKSTLVGKIGTLLTGVASGVSALRASLSDTSNTSGSFNPWFTNIHTWKSGQSINVTTTFEFAMGQYGLWNAKEEVVKPIINLLAPCLPQYMNSMMQYGAFPNTMLLIVDMIKSLFSSEGEDSVGEFEFEKNGTPATTDDDSKSEGSLSQSEIDNLAEKIESFVLRKYKQYTYDIKYGNTFTFYKMLPVSANPNFSNEFDQYGYPISGSIEVKFLGLMPITLTSSTENERAVRYGSFVTHLNGNTDTSSNKKTKEPWHGSHLHGGAY